MKTKNIYLDGAANTPVDPAVFKAMKPFLNKNFVGNTHAIHEHGIFASMEIETARSEIGKCLAVDPSGIYFTSGATESNNWVLQSLCLHELGGNSKKSRRQIIVSSIEHSSILSACKFLETVGIEVIYVDPEPNGCIDENKIKKLITSKTLLVCVMAINNETGSPNLIDKIGCFAHSKGAYMMSDCTQYLSVGGSFIELGNYFPNVDYFTFSAHKIYGPTGVGCLIVNNKAPIYPYMYGGGQESGLRGGTSNTASIIGMAKAIKLLHKEKHYTYFYKLGQYFVSKLIETFDQKIIINGYPKYRNIYSLNLSHIFNQEQLAAYLTNYGISCSAGSACDSETGEENVPSHVLKAMGLSNKEISNTIRVSFTKYTTKKDIDKFCEILKKLYLKEN